MPERTHSVSFSPSGRSAQVRDGGTILEAAQLAQEPIAAECGGRGACGRCRVQVLDGEVPEYRVLRGEGRPEVLACLTPVRGALEVRALDEAALPGLVARERSVGLEPLSAWAPHPLVLDPLVVPATEDDLGVAIDLGTTTLKLMLLRLADGRVIGEASAYNPQISRGADVISRIVAAERGELHELTAAVRAALAELVVQAAASAAAHASSASAGASVRNGGASPAPLPRLERIRAYVVAGNLTMIHLLLGVDPSGIRRVPSRPAALSFDPLPASTLGWPGAPDALVHTVPAAGGWVGGDIVAGVVRAGFAQRDELTLYVDLGTNGELALGGTEFALVAACSAGPAFEGGGIRCGMRADPGAIDGGRIDESGTLELSVIDGGRPRGLCGSGLISLAHALLAAGWIDRQGRFTAAVPARYRLEGANGPALRLDEDTGEVALYERDLASLVRAKGAIFAGIRSLLRSLGEGSPGQIIVSGNFGRFLNLPAAMGIGLLPSRPLERCSYVGNGSLEGAALLLLSRAFGAELESYLARVTYLDLSEVQGYMDELVGACFLPHTDPALLEA